jgi:Lon protease-like protein
MHKIFLFPLHLVIYPGSSYPLHIFEDRYKKMINHCLETHTGFGIITIQFEASKIGTYVEISRIIKKYPDGKLDIVVKGIRRFEVLTSETNKDDILEGEIKPYPDLVFDVDKKIMETVFSKFKDILQKINLNLESAFWEKLNNAPFKSFKIAEKTGLTLEQQNQLLVLQDETKRLNYLFDHLEKLEKYLSESKIVKEIVMRDGFLN